MGGHRPARSRGTVPIFATALLLTSCLAPRTEEVAGRLLIIGGGLRVENESVYRRLLDRVGEDARIVVLPTASGVPEESGPGTAEDLERYCGPDQEVEVVPILATTFERAFDEELVAKLAAAEVFWFTGGVQSRILAVFRPDGEDTPAFRAVQRRLAEGAVVAGSSAGAAMMSDPMIAWGNSREALLVGVRNDVEDRAVALEQGMGFFPGGLTDQHFSRRGRLGRLVVALEASGRRFGFGVCDNRALEVDLAAGTGEAIGQRAVVVVDVSRGSREGLSRLGLRLSLLSDGDRVELSSGDVRPRLGKPPLEPPKPGEDEAELPGPWGRDAILRLLERLAREPSSEHRATGEAFDLVVRADGETRFHSARQDLEDLCACSVVLDIVASPGAAALAEELSRELEEKKSGEGSDR